MPRRRQLFFEARQTEQMARRTERRRALARTPCLASAYTKGALRRLSSFYLLVYSPSFATGRPSYAQGRMLCNVDRDSRFDTALPTNGESASVRCRVGSYMAAEAPTAPSQRGSKPVLARQSSAHNRQAHNQRLYQNGRQFHGLFAAGNDVIDSLCALSGWELQPTWSKVVQL